jgi:DNA-binding NtrC family response regulator
LRSDIPTARILLVDDDEALLRSIGRILKSWGFEVVALADSRAAIDRLGVERFDLVITDYTMPVLTGIDVLRAVNERQPGVPTVFVTAHASVERAVEAMRLGAYHFITKPFDQGHLKRIVTGALRQEPAEPTRGAIDSARILLGESPAMRELRTLIREVADSDATVLILGESGTGKEVVARTLHLQSSRRGRAFIPVHCGAIPEPLLESELFGHVKGAFTGATQARIGRFQIADRGTLFLDEIGDMPVVLQVKLLRVLQERTFEPVGSDRTVQVDVRIVAATNQDLEELVKVGKFREDLFYRLNVIPLTVPALRERREDIPLLLSHFLTRHAEARGARVLGFSDDAIGELAAFDWPGNVRELENLVERLVVIKRHGTIGVSDLPDKYRARPPAAAPSSEAALGELPEEGIDLRRVLASYEESLIAQALARAGGNKTRAGELLGLNRTTLVEKLKRIPALQGMAEPAAEPERPVPEGNAPADWRPKEGSSRE